MRFERIRVRAFGALEDLDTGPDELPSLVALHAPNEGGKSTFFVLLSSLLYGFYPASREGHPYAPWSGADADADAVVRLSGDRRVTVHRRLLASPWGRLIRDGEEEDLANRTVPWAGHVRRQLFDEVYALTLADLARVDEERWPEIQDRLLGSMGADDVRGARDVVEELEDEARDLWRPDRRGTPRDRELRGRLKELNRARQEAKERDREAREKARTLEELRERRETIRHERRAARALVERARTLDPVRHQLARIRDAEESAGDPAELEGLPERPGERLDELREAEADLRARLEDQEAEAAGLRERANSLEEGDEVLLERAAEIRELGKVAGEVGAGRGRLAALEERIEGLERRVREAARELFDRPWGEVAGESVRSAPLGELRARIGRYRERAEEATRIRERLEDRERRAPPEPGAGPGLLGAALLLGGLGLALRAAAAELGPGWLLGGVVPALAGGYLVLRHRWSRARREEYRRAARDLEGELDRAERAVAEARRAVADSAGDLPLAAARLENPRPELVHVLERLQDHLAALEQARSEAGSLAERFGDAEERAAVLSDEVGLEVGAAELPGRIVALERALEAAEERRSDARSAREALEQSERALGRLREQSESLEAERKELEERLAGLAGGDPDRGAEAARTRIRHREKARVLREELERRHPDLDGLRRRIREAEEAGEEWTASEEALVAAEEKVDGLNEEEKELIGEIRDLENGLARLEEETTLDRIEGEILTVEEELDEVRRRRDRLALLARVVRAADRRFRERNQPDLLKAAGHHLSKVTDGRYRRLLVPERDLDGTLLLQGPGYPGPVEVDTPVSTGTREQVYLALRLAIVDHLDSGSERLPLFLDEAFVNWDEERRERGFELLAELAEERQIFVFTCHRPMARSLADRGARLLSLPAPE